MEVEVKNLIEKYKEKALEDKKLLSDKYEHVSYGIEIVLSMLNSLEQAYQDKLKRIDEEKSSLLEMRGDFDSDTEKSEFEWFNAEIQGLEKAKQILEGRT